MEYLLRLRKIFKHKYLLFGIFVLLFVLVAGGVSLGVYTHSDPILKKLEREKQNTERNIVNDVTEINPVQVEGIVVPHTADEIVAQVKTHEHVSIGGGRNSMGGQTASERAIQIDMREYNKILNFSAEKKEITVQAGIRWRDIQDYIDPYDLSVKIMQTYSNFTVGGSLSVNVHGRYVGLGPIILSVKKFTIVLADGNIIEASPSENVDIFYSAIGGMGGIGVISDVTLSLADNVNVERSRVELPTTEYARFFREHIRSDPKVIFHNGDMYPPNFDNISAVSWSETDRGPTTAERLIPRRADYWKERIAWVVMSEWYGGRWIREHIIDPFLYRGEVPVHTRNYEASYDVAELEPENRDFSTYVLQEYFVPVEHFDTWIPKMKKVFNDNHVNVINVSIRHTLPDSGAKLAWAKKESFAFVVYYKQGTDEDSRNNVAKWTGELIDEVLSVDGRYYLPYQIWASDDQFHRAYPGAIEYFELKKAYDPTDKFTNKLWDKYYSQEKLEYFKEKEKQWAVVEDTAGYFRPFDNAYLSLPEWYIVYAADEYAKVLKDGLPSEFDYFGANREYWKQYHQVTSLTASSQHNNEPYKTVLDVIGWSFSAENIIKGVYEKSFGRLSEWIAGKNSVVEDKYAAQVANDYAVFIYDYPWYDFSYWNALKGLWTLKNEESTPFRQDIRRAERKIILSIEYGVKFLYSSVIAAATHMKFGVQDDVVSAIVTRDGGKSYLMIQAPHYQPFTRLLLDEMKREEDNPDFSIVDIAGNSRITFTYREREGAHPIDGVYEVTRDREIAGIANEQPTFLDRVTVEADVRLIFPIFKRLSAEQINIDHFYDY